MTPDLPPGPPGSTQSTSGVVPGPARFHRPEASAIRDWGRWIHWLGVPSQPSEWLSARWKAFRTDRRFRVLRWALAIGLATRLLLAPLTSFTGDTTGFALGDLAFVYLGSPYTSSAYFNPPLANFVQLPFVALTLLVLPPQTLVSYVPGLLPGSTAIALNFVTPWQVAPLLLLAIKVPLILADVGTTLVLVRLLDSVGRYQAAPYVGVAYFLNPLVIWISAIHGEPDGLAVLFVLLTLVALLYRNAPAAGVALGLAIFAKAYPAILIPLAVVVITLGSLAERPGWLPALRRVGAFAVGLGGVALVFLPYLSFLSSVVNRETPVTSYGGISVLTLYNAGTPALAGLTSFWQRLVPGPRILLGLEAVAVATAVISPAALVIRHRISLIGDRAWALGILAAASLAMVAGLLLAYPAPQPENVVAVVPFALLLPAVVDRRSLSWLGWVVSLSGFGLYLAYGTPLAALTPTLVLLGPSALRSANAVFLTYGSGGYGFPPPVYWFAIGFVGGVALLGLWGSALWFLFAKNTAAPPGDEHAW